MKKKISIITFISLLLGLVLGYFLPEVAKELSFLGNIYINILKLLIVPVVFSSISVSIYHAKGSKDRLVLKSIVLFILMFSVTFLLTSLVVSIIKPGSSFKFENVDWNGETTQITISSLLINLLPTSLMNFITGGKLFLVILLSFVFGFVFSFKKEESKVMNSIELVRDFLFNFLELFMYFTPVAVFSLISNTIAVNGIEFIIIGLRYIGCAYLCGILTIVLVMILPVTLIRKISPIEYIKKVSRIWLMTITTCSSSATLPYTMQVCRQQFNISDKVTDIVVPLGCTIHMCGGAVSFALLGLFCCSIYNVPVNFLTYLLMLFLAIIINMSAPGIPNGGVVIGATYLEALGCPIDFIGFYSGIYKVLDMLYTTLNVTGDITANILLDNGKKD